MFNRDFKFQFLQKHQIIARTGLGFVLPHAENKVRGKESVITTDDSKVKVLLIPTNEELMIARETKALV